MKKRLIYIYVNLWILIPAVVLFASCADENVFDPQESTSVTFTLNLPQANVIETRASDETINNLYILAFEKTGSKVLKEVHNPTGFTKTPGRTDQYKLTLNSLSSNLELVALANITPQLIRTSDAGSLPSVISVLTDCKDEGKTKDEVFDRLVTYYDGNYTSGDKYKWPNANNGLTAGNIQTHIPMWGELKEYNRGAKNEFEMIRMLAKINVNNVATSVFQMTEIYFCNYARKSCLMVKDGNYDVDAKKVTKVTISGSLRDTGGVGAKKQWDLKTIKYIPSSQNYKDQIYVYESEKVFGQGDKYHFPSKDIEENWMTGTNWNWATIPCLIIAGKYKNSTEVTYYRVDFIDADDNWCSGVLRNHCYEVKITNVKGPGYKNNYDAAISAPMNMDATTYISNESDKEITVVDGPYYLTIPKAEYTVMGDVIGAQLSNVDYKTHIMFTTNQNNVEFEVQRYEDEACEKEILLKSGSVNDWLQCKNIKGHNGATMKPNQAVPTDYEIYTGEINTGMHNKEFNMTNKNRVVYLKFNVGRMSAVVKATQIHTVIPYVGAFWKHNERAERLIRMPVPEGYSYDWEASVISGQEWIRMDTKKSPAYSISSGSPGAVTYNAGTEKPENPDVPTLANANYYVDGGTTTVRGSIPKGTPEKDRCIYFRLGLTGFSSTNRYGVVLLTYTNKEDNHTIQNKIWIRQGETSDCLMRKQDTQDGIPRDKVVMFSPYNLTAAAIENENATATVQVKKGKFTEYPSQVGAYTYSVSRKFFHPSKVHSSGSMGVGNEVVWNPSLYETCPGKYRRPNDGTIFTTPPDNSNPTVADSEIRQSLFKIPNDGRIDQSYKSEERNSEWGYYADGFFDRRAISTPTDGDVDLCNDDRWPICAVAKGKSNVAYIGRLFYNPYNDASLFFPAGGMLDSSTWDNLRPNKLGEAGRSCYYFTTAMDVNYQGKWVNWTLALTRGGSELKTANMNIAQCAFPIRCVKDLE
ncbi:hypothetical protein [Bacteroides sp. 224]|uniref:hypothetical protein n=1 Tax=Bacteroides sp. 224 TaxID=2302936 RepID=UPI0013D2737D|nr:hypothetical protein [Bacteroides sp. 224]NDV65244.1 hypothetical protein [Bacteroides sp. 224]